MFQGAAADRFLDSLSSFINGLDTKNNVKVRLKWDRKQTLKPSCFWTFDGSCFTVLRSGSIIKAGTVLEPSST